MKYMANQDNIICKNSAGIQGKMNRQGSEDFHGSEDTLL